MATATETTATTAIALQHIGRSPGAEVMSAKIDCVLTASEFRNDETVKEVYYPAITNLLRRTFPDAAEMQIIEHAIRTLGSVV